MSELRIGLILLNYCVYFMESSRYLPFASNYIHIEGHRMHYVDEGAGDVVILLHGNPTWCYYYRTLIQRLKGKFRLIAPDMIGCGLSDHPAVSFRAVDRMKHLVTFIKALGIERFSMVLHDWGGPIGTGAALELYDRLDKIVYLNTTLTEIESLPSMIKTAASPLIGQVLTQYTKRFLSLLLRYGVTRKLSRDEWAGYVEPYQTIARRRAIWDFVKDIPFTQHHPTYQTLNRLGAELPKLKERPIKIIWGLKDPCFHLEMLEKVAGHFPNAEVHEFSDASHLVLEDKPEEVGALIEEFLTRSNAVKKRDDGSAKSGVAPSVNVQTSLSGESALFAGFRQSAQKSPHQQAVIETVQDKNELSYKRTSAAELMRLTIKYQRGLKHLGLLPGDKVLFLVPASRDFLALVYATLGCGAIPVFVDPGVGRPNLLRCIEDTRPDAFISVPKGHLLKLLSRNAFSKCRFHVTATRWRVPGVEHTLQFLEKFSSTPLEVINSSGTELIAFTSGATGTPKGVVYTSESTNGLLSILRDSLGIRAGDVDMPLLPVFSIFNTALGVTTVFPPMDAAKPLDLDPEITVRVLRENGCTSSFGSPTLWHKLAEYCVRSGITLPGMNRILIAGAPVSDNVLETVGRVVDPSNVYTPYGSTEALPVTLLSAAQRAASTLVTAVSGEQGTLVGKPVAGVEVAILPHDSGVRSGDGGAGRSSDGISGKSIQERKLPPREIGDIVVKGIHVSPSYLHRPDAVQRSKIADGTTFWHRMGDMGYLDDLGNLYFCGRAAHMVEVNGSVKYSIPVERIFNAHSAVRRSALVQLDSPQGRAAGIVIEPYPEFFPADSTQEGRFTAELEALGAGSPLVADIHQFFYHRSFPVDGRHNAKIFRDKLGEWASGELAKKKKKVVNS